MSDGSVEKEEGWLGGLEPEAYFKGAWIISCRRLRTYSVVGGKLCTTGTVTIDAYGKGN